jgi:hypothetical protein
MKGPLSGSRACKQRGASGWWLRSARSGRVWEVRTAWCVCRQQHPSQGRRCAGGGAQTQHDAADAGPPQYVDFVFENSGPAWGPRKSEGAAQRPRERASSEARVAGGCGRRGVGACGKCARRGACAGNGIQAEGAVALAAALQGDTTLKTLNLYGTWTARTRAFCGNGRPLPGDLASARAGRRERLVGAVGAACASAGNEHGMVGVQTTQSRTRALRRLRRRSKATRIWRR